MDDFVSVIIPTYNAERFIGKAIRSVLLQTHRDFELIVIDNASMDNTAGVVEEFASRDVRIRLIRNEKNIGFQRSVNRALKAARYEYIAKIDAPDWMPPYRLAEQKEYLDGHPEVAVVGGDVESYDEGLNKIEIRRLSDHYLPVELLFGCYISHSAVMYRKSVVMNYGGYDEELVRAEDYDLWTKFLLDGFYLENLPRVMSFERVFKGQGADFLKKEERQTGRRAQLRVLDAVCPPGFAQPIRKVATDSINDQFPLKDIYDATRYFCSDFLTDLQGFYPYQLNRRAELILKTMIGDFVRNNLLHPKGWAALRAARAEGWDVIPLMTPEGIWQSLRRWLGDVKRGLFT